MNKAIKRSVFAILASVAVNAHADTWRYALEENITDVQGVYATKFKEVIEKNSDHKVQIFPFGTLGESSATLEQAQRGVIQFVDQSPGFTGSIIPEAQVFLLPYVFPEDDKAIEKFFKNSKTINELFPPLYEKQGLHLLKMFPEGAVSISTKKAFKTPEDLNGMKIRVMTSPLLVETYKAFGAVPTPLPWGEVFGALQTNLLDGQENPMFWIESAKMYEVTDVITDIGHNIFTTAVMANKKFYDGLSDEDKALVQKASNEAQDYILKYQEGLRDKAKAEILKKRPEVKFVTLTDEQRTPFREAAKDVQKKFVELTGANGEAILKQMLQDVNDAQK